MKALHKFLLALAIVLLLLNAIGAIYGGISFVLNPSGKSLGMPVSWLNKSPFSDYLIPGIILLIANGIGSLIALGLILCKIRYRYAGIAVQGIILLGWMSVQIIMLQTFAGPQIAFTAIGVSLTLLGLTLSRINK